MSCSSGRVGVGYERDTCSFTCNTGYELTGSNTRTCQSNGNWNGNETICTQGMDMCVLYILANYIQSFITLHVLIMIWTSLSYQESWH